MKTGPRYCQNPRWPVRERERERGKKREEEREREARRKGGIEAIAEGTL